MLGYGPTPWRGSSSLFIDPRFIPARRSHSIRKGEFMHGVVSTRVRVFVGLAFVFMLAPAIASAQSAISGIVRDTSGAVMPGVQVEASSDVLIEKVRSVVSDGEGRYSIVDLRPGTYTVVFTLAGFNAFRREC